MVRCVECGLLTARHRETRECQEVEQPTRETGTLTGPHELPLTCFVHAQRIDVEFHEHKKQGGEGNLPRVTLEVIEQQRECGQFTPWHPGSSPKEHAEMVREELLRKSIADREAADRAWRAEQDEKRREAEAAQKEADRRFHQEQRAEDLARSERIRKEDLRQRWLLAILPIIAGAIGFFIAWVMGLKK